MIKDAFQRGARGGIPDALAMLAEVEALLHMLRAAAAGLPMRRRTP